MSDYRESSTRFSETTNKNGRRKSLLLADDFYVKEYQYTKSSITVKTPVEGMFYEAELQRVNKTRDNLWKMETVLKRRKRRGQTEVLVKWQGYPKKFNSWVNEDELQNI